MSIKRWIWGLNTVMHHYVQMNKYPELKAKAQNCLNTYPLRIIWKASSFCITILSWMPHHFSFIFHKQFSSSQPNFLLDFLPVFFSATSTLSLELICSFLWCFHIFSNVTLNYFFSSALPPELPTHRSSCPRTLTLGWSISILNLHAENLTHYLKPSNTPPPAHTLMPVPEFSNLFNILWPP